jgi:hypothetical protein
MINTRKRQRSRVRRRVSTGVAAGAVVGLAVAGVAVAARRTERILPKIPAPGATAEVELISKGVELAVAGRTIRTGRLQGSAAIEIEAHFDDPAAVRTRVKTFRLASIDDRDGITITVEPKTGTRPDASVLRNASAQSPRFHHTLALACTITIADPRKFGLEVGSDEPLSLIATVPVELSGKPSAFPDSRAQYKLDRPVALSASGRSAGIEARILKFPLKMQTY